MCQSAHRGVVEALWLACEFHCGNPLCEVADDLARFHAGQVCPEAEVHAATERQVVNRAAVEAERVRVLELAGVAIGRAEQQHHT